MHCNHFKRGLIDLGRTFLDNIFTSGILFDKKYRGLLVAFLGENLIIEKTSTKRIN
jgi:hypothetical protein